MAHKVSSKECLDAIEYFHTMGMIENCMSSDEVYYVKILLKKVANDYKITLVGI